MPRLILVLRDLYPARLSEAARATLPRLPQLEQWLAQGEVDHAAGDWRQWLQREMCEGTARHAPPGSIAAAAVPSVPSDVPVWFAVPVHLVAGLDTVRVHPAGILQLSGEHQQQLRQDFARVFADSGWSLHATGRREMLLAGGAAASQDLPRTHDPALWVGTDPRQGLPSGPGADALRRVGAEMEMWLHEHPVNLARQADGELSANAMWIWGGGAPKIATPAVVVPKAAAVAQAWANDLFIDGLARLEGRGLAALPERWPQSPSVMRAPEAQLLAVCELRPEAGEHTLVVLERDWIAPALEQWRLGQWQRATLLAGGCAATLGRARLRGLWRRWKRTRPWWETLRQC